MRLFKTLFILVILTGTSNGQENIKRNEFSDYFEMRKYFGTLYQQKKYDDAAVLLENHLKIFPERLEVNLMNLSIVYSHLNKYEEGIKILNYGHEKGIWYNIYSFRGDFFKPYKDLDGFKKMLEKNEEMRQEAQVKAKPELLVVTPENYNPEKKYPLFIALHGGSSTITNFKPRWTSGLMKKEFVTAYVQSSLLVGMDVYAWTVDIEVSKRELVDAYKKVAGDYKIDEDEIIIGGFSAGGVAAMEIALCDLIPVSGYIALCPAKPASFTEEKIADSVSRGLRGSIITNEMDPRLSVQKEMVEWLKKAGSQYQFIVTPNIGHWFPKDMDEKIDDSIRHIRYK